MVPVNARRRGKSRTEGGDRDQKLNHAIARVVGCPRHHVRARVVPNPRTVCHFFLAACDPHATS
jgi:hypothetical protein